MGLYDKAMRKIMHYSMLMLCSHQKFVRQSTSSHWAVIEQSSQEVIRQVLGGCQGVVRKM